MPDNGLLAVARFLDGRLIKGRTTDLRPKNTFHIVGEGASRPTLVKVDDLKAIFFIKSLEGNPAHEERKDYRRKGLGTRIWIEFLDGEELAGWSMTFSPDDDGFRLFPADPGSNIEMLYVFRHALRRILTEEDAVIAAREYQVRKNKASSGSLGSDDWERFLIR